jgi:hypothetical protein
MPNYYNVIGSLASESRLSEANRWAQQQYLQLLITRARHTQRDIGAVATVLTEVVLEHFIFSCSDE